MSCETCKDKCCLISYKCVLDNTPLNSLSDEEQVMKSVLLAQPDIVKDILKKDCYVELCAALEAESGDPSIPLPDEMVALKKAIIAPLAWRSFHYWVTYYANVVYANSATTNVTDRKGSGFQNITKQEKDRLLLDINNKYEFFKSEALEEIADLNLSCSPDEDCAKKCDTKHPKVDDELSHLPDVV